MCIRDRAMTMTQKILAKHAGLDAVVAGQLIEAKLDVVMANDIPGPMALPIFHQMADKDVYKRQHTKWMCKYHIVLTPKYRRKVIYNQLRNDIREIIIRLCQYRGVEILEGHLMSDHVQMLVMIPTKLSVSSFMGYLKGK